MVILIGINYRTFILLFHIFIAFTVAINFYWHFNFNHPEDIDHKYKIYYQNFSYVFMSLSGLESILLFFISFFPSNPIQIDDYFLGTEIINVPFAALTFFYMLSNFENLFLHVTVQIEN